MIDSHAHILKEYYKDELDSVLKESLSQLDMIFNISFSISSAREIVEMCRIHKNMYSVIGVHPNDVVDEENNYVNDIEKLIDDRVKAIGEVGLDYHYEGYNKELQKKVFIEFIELAKRKNLPVVIHSRDANEDTIKIIENYKDVIFLFHSWSGNAEQTKLLNDWGNIYFSYNGIATFKNAEVVRETLRLVNKDKILAETDCPYLTPVPFRGKMNYPKYVQYVYELIESETGLTEKEIDENTKRFFNV